jgi:hypothetical protein
MENSRRGAMRHPADLTRHPTHHAAFLTKQTANLRRQPTDHAANLREQTANRMRHPTAHAAFLTKQTANRMRHPTAHAANLREQTAEQRSSRNRCWQWRRMLAGVADKKSPLELANTARNGGTRSGASFKTRLPRLPVHAPAVIATA